MYPILALNFFCPEAKDKDTGKDKDIGKDKDTGKDKDIGKG